MKRLITILSLIFFLALRFTAGAQSMANYSFSTTTGVSLIDISSGSTTALTSGTDNTPSGLFDIGFNAIFMGVIYTQFSVSPDGFLKYGPPATGSQSSNLLTSINNIPKLAPYWDDLSTGTNGYVRFKTIGTAPNRQLVVEWRVTVPWNLTGPATATYQAVINETSGVIEFIYGDIPIGLSYSVGMTSSASQFASVTVSNNTVSYSTANNAQNIAIAGGRSYSFTPPALPTAPGGLNFTGVTQTGMTLNWSDNSSNETGFVIYKSTDGTNYNYITTLSAGAVTYNVTGLLPGQTYYWKVHAINEGTMSTATSNSQATNPAGSITSVSTGLWSATSTWSGGAVPISTDDVTIANGHIVTIDAASNCNILTVQNGGNLQFEPTTPRILTVVQNVTVDAGGTFQSAASGSVSTHNVSLGGNFTNNGTLDFSTSTGGNTAGATITFTGNGTANFTLGPSSVSDFWQTSGVTLNKGSNITSILNFYPAGTITVKGGITLGFINISNGYFILGGTGTFNNPLFHAANYTIPATGGFWLNNPNAIVVGTNGGSPSLLGGGTLRITSGTYNIGFSSSISLSFGNSASTTVIIEGGAINVTGRFGVSNAAYIVGNFTMTNGTLTVATAYNSSTTVASFDAGTSTSTNFTMSGGTINIVKSSGTAGPRSYRGPDPGANVNITGGTLNLGTATSPATAQKFHIMGAAPKVTLTNTSANHTCTLSGNLQVRGDLILNGSGTFSDSIYNLDMRGMNATYPGNITNNGTLTLNPGASKSLKFSSSFGNQSLTNNGTITSNRLPNTIISNMYSGGTVTLPSGLTISNGTSTSASLSLVAGTLTATSLSLGGGGTSGFTLTRTNGSLANAPTFAFGSGTVDYTYNGTAAQVTGLELPSSISGTLTINNPNGLTLNAPFSCSNLNLTNGVVNTTSANLLSIGNATTEGTLSGGSSTAYINGPFARTFAASRTASGTYDASTLFPVGKNSTYLPFWIDPATSAGGAVIFSGQAFGTNSGTPGGVFGSLSSKRWEALVVSGNSNLTNSFLKISDQEILPSNKILQAVSAAGVYDSIPAPTVYNAGPPISLSSGSSIPAASFYGYISYGDTSSFCSPPSAQPTNLVTSLNTPTGFTGSFTAAVPPPSHYLVVRYAAGSAPVNPANFTNYTAGAAIGTGIVRASDTSTSFIETGLTAGTTYDYYIYSFNNGDCTGPVYNTVSPLFSSVTTCAVAVGVPGTPTASAITDVSFTASWTASSTPGVIYLLDVATNASFTSFVSGYNGKNVGTNLYENITGLIGNTLYHVRVRAFDNTATCISEFSGTLMQTTLVSSPFPYEEGFLTTSTPAGWNITGWLIGTDRGVTGNPGNNIYKNFWTSSPTGTFTTVTIGSLPEYSNLTFDYILANYSSPYGPPESGSGNFVVSISTDFGINYTVLETVPNNGVAGWQSKQYDLSSYAGSKIKIKITGNWTSGDYDLAFDNFRVIMQESMSYVSSTTTQSASGSAPLGVTNVHIISVQVVTQNSLSPLSVTKIKMNMTGTTAESDIAAARIYYSGTINTFSTSTQFGSQLTSPSGSIYFNGSQALSEGINYFWLVYDIASTATLGNLVDAQCDSVIVEDAYYAPTVSSPAGSLTIIESPLSGPLTVGSGGNFSTLTGADGLFESINNQGMSGSLVVTITSSITNEPGTYSLTSWSEYGGSGYTLTIMPAASTTPTISGSLDYNALFRFNGASRVIIDGSNNGTSSRDLTLSNTSVNDPYVLLFGSNGINTITDVTLKNCVITNGSTSASAVVVSDAPNLGDPGYFDNLVIDNNLIQNAYIGLFMIADAGAGTNFMITNNDLNATGENCLRYGGIYLEGMDSGTISGNEIGNFNQADDEDDFGIAIGNFCTSIEIHNNRIDNLGYNGIGGFGPHGIEVSTWMTDAGISIYNNLISDLTGDGYNYADPSYGNDNPIGILLTDYQTGIFIDYNSIFLDGNTLNTPDAMSMGICMRSGSVAEISNNIIVNNLGLLSATGYGACGIFAETSNTQFTVINNNDYFVNPTGPGAKDIGRISATAATTLAAWQTATGQDASSINNDPIFTDSLLHLDGLYSPANGKAAPIAIIPDDYAGIPRHPSHPTIGAHEYTPILTWTGIIGTAWNNPGNWSPGTIPDGTFRALIPTTPLGGNFPAIPNGYNAYSFGLTLENGTSIEVQNGGTLNILNP